MSRNFLLVSGSVVLILAALAVNAYFPEQDPWTGPGLLYFLPTNVFGLNNSMQVTGLYNNTVVQWDENLNMIWDNGGVSSNCVENTSTAITLNRSSTTALNDDCGVGSLLKASKPVGVAVKLYGSSKPYASIPPLSQLGTEHVVPFTNHTTYVIATQENTIVQVDGETTPPSLDRNSDGEYDLGDYLNISNLTMGSMVNSSNPVMIVEYDGQNMMVLPPTEYLGQDYYLPFDASSSFSYYIVATANNTLVRAHYQGTTSNLDTDLDLGERVFCNNTADSCNRMKAGSHVNANNTVYLIAYDTGYLGLIPPAKRTGSVYYTSFNASSTDNIEFIATTQPYTEVTVSNITNQSTQSFTLDGESLQYTSSLPAGSKLNASMPFLMASKSTDYFDALGGAYLVSSQYVTPAYVQANEIQTVYIVLFNPLTESAYNITVNGSIPDSFTPRPITSELNVTVQRYNALTDALISSSEERSVALSTVGSTYHYSVSYTSFSNLTLLEPDTYAIVSYQLTSPASYGWHSIPQANVYYSGDAWTYQA